MQPANDTIVGAMKHDLDKRIEAAIAGKDWIKAHDLAAGAIRLLNGMGDVAAYNKQLRDIENAGYKTAVAAQGKLQQDELQQQQELLKQFAGLNEKWLTDKVKQLEQNAQHAKTPQEAQMNKRVLSYLEFVGYMYTDHALKAGDLASAGKCLDVFRKANPRNADGGYLAAVLHMQQGDRARAIASLNEAAVLGYDEVGKLLTDPAFSSIAEDEGFKKVVEKVRANYTTK